MKTFLVAVMGVVCLLSCVIGADVVAPDKVSAESELTNWTHVAVVYQNCQPKIWVNGSVVRAGQVSRMIAHPGQNLGDVSGYGCFSGMIRDALVVFALFCRSVAGPKSSPKELIPICRNENTPCTTARRGRVALPEDIDNLYRFHGRARRPCRAVSIQG